MFKEEMLDYLNTKIKFHRVDYETLTDDILRIIFVLYKDLDRKESSMKHLQYQNEQLKKQLNEKVEMKLFQNAYETLDEICEMWDKLDQARNDFYNLMNKKG